MPLAHARFGLALVALSAATVTSAARLSAEPLAFTVDLRGVDLGLGAGALRIERLRARWSPNGGVVVVLDGPELRARALPALDPSRLPAFDGRVIVHRGRIVIAGQPPIDHVEAELDAHLARGGRAGRLAIGSFSGRVATGSGPIAWSTSGSARWDARRARVALEVPRIVVGHSGARLRAEWARGQLSAEVTELSIAPQDVHALAPSVALTRPITGRLRARGPLSAIALDGALEPGRGRVAIAGRLDARALTAEARLDLDRVEPDFLPTAQPMVVSGAIALAATRDRADVTARGQYQHRQIDAQLASLTPAGRASDRELGSRLVPGGRVEGAGCLERQGREWIGSFTARVRDPGAATRALGRRAPERVLRVDGSYRQRPGVLRVHTRSERADAR